MNSVGTGPSLRGQIPFDMLANLINYLTFPTKSQALDQEWPAQSACAPCPLP